MAFDTHVMLEAMSFDLVGAAGSRSAIGYDAFLMRIVTGGTGDVSLFAQGQQNAVLNFHVFYARQYILGWFAKVFGMENLFGFSGVASYTESLHIADEPGIFKAGNFFIGYLSVTVQTGLFINFFFRIQLQMGIVHLIVGLVVAGVTDSHHGVIWRPPQKFLLF